MVNVCTWNVRGLNCATKRGLVKSLVTSLPVSVLCLQESKLSLISRSFLRSFAGPGFDRCHFIPSTGASGGLVTCWNSRFFTCLEVLVRNHSLTLRLRCARSGISFYLTNAYGPPTWGEKTAFCHELTALKPTCTGPWCVCGDFNLTRAPSDRLGSNACNRLMSLFSETINELELVDLPLTNQSFTWSNMQRTPTMAKLDRFLISTDWDSAFPLSSVAALPRITSDHFPLLLKTTEGPHKARIFRFEKVWLTRSDFVGLVPVWWNEVGPRLGRQGSILTFNAKLRHCRKRIKEWCSANFHSITKSSRALTEEIQRLDTLEELRLLTSSEADLRRDLKNQLKGIISEEEIL